MSLIGGAWFWRKCHGTPTKATPSSTMQDNSATRDRLRDPRAKISPRAARIAEAIPSRSAPATKRKEALSGNKPRRQPSGALARNINASAAKERASNGPQETIHRDLLGVDAWVVMSIFPGENQKGATAIQCKSPYSAFQPLQDPLLRALCHHLAAERLVAWMLNVPAVPRSAAVRV